MCPGKENYRSGDKGVEKSIPHIIVSIVHYVSDSVLARSILRKTSGNVTVLAFAMGEEQAEMTSPFVTFIQVIDGSAEIYINKKLFTLQPGQGLVIPGHSAYYVNALEQFKMISTTIKSGYDESIG